MLSPDAPVPPITWAPPGRRSRLRAAAAPMLIAALRRVVALPPGYSLFVHDLEALDTRRPTLARLAAAASWEQAHPQRSRPFLHNLLHAAYVLRAVGLAPSRVHATRSALGLPSDASDEALLRCAHLAAICFSVHRIQNLVDVHGWTDHDLLWWTHRHDEAHFEACIEIGMTAVELRDLIRQEQVPGPEQVALMAAFARDLVAS